MANKTKTQQSRKENMVRIGHSSVTALVTCFTYFFLTVCYFWPAGAAVTSADAININDGHNNFWTGNGSNIGAKGSGLGWDHVIDLNEDFRILWTIINQEITFEIQARALGYVGFGFSPDAKLAGSDIAIGWVDEGQTYFQDRHIQRNGNVEPILDPSQDYVLMFGHENATHTILRFRRKLDTCDTMHDLPITNDTMHLIYMYHDLDPPHGYVRPGTLPDPQTAFHFYRPMSLTQMPNARIQLSDKVRQLELRNEDVELPSADNSLFWCKMFKLEDAKGKHHLIKYEPIYDSSYSVRYLQHIKLYECQGSQSDLEIMAREQGRQCMVSRDMPLICGTLVASWSRGSNGFTFPNEAGYPIESRKTQYYVMETYYSNVQPNFSIIQTRQMVDNSGLRIFFTQELRPHDAGILSIGIDPNWRHIIPPKQSRVISEGQCLEDCTAYAFPSDGIKIFAVLMRTHLIGKEVKLRQIRQTEELPPIAQDASIDPAYQEFRHLSTPVVSMPGDRLIAECIYDSSSRNAITLGGLTMKEETCTVLALYYPRQKELTVCHSLPSLPTVLNSLGIKELATDTNPVLISSPPNLAGMTLEERLITYDWLNQFSEFQNTTRSGSFKPLCWGDKNRIIPGSEYLEGYSVNITKIYEKPMSCKPKPHQASVANDEVQSDLKLPVLHELDNNNVIEGAARSSRSSAATDVQVFSKANTRTFAKCAWLLSILIVNIAAPKQ